MKRTLRGAFWISVYLIVVLSPLAFALIDLAPGRGILINLSVALGFVGLSMMGLQFALVAHLRRTSEPFGIDVLLQFHRQISYVAIVFILAHPILLFVESTVFLALLNPFTAPLRAHFAVLSVMALLTLVTLSIWRKQLRIRYEVWQLLHNVLAIVAVVAALLHVLLVNYYVDEPWEKALWILMTVAFITLGVWVRFIRPWQRYRHSWRVAEVITEHGDTHTIVLEPKDERDRDRFTFEAGQFAWIMAGQSPFSIAQHPFSFSSSSEGAGEEVSISIKSAGDFTSLVGQMTPGSTIYLDGPYGSFTLDRHEGPGFVFVGAGVGVTPLMSMMLTLADRGDRRPCYLFLNNRTRDDIIFRERIETLKERLDLTVVHVLSHENEEWTGERGHIDADLLRRHLPERYRGLQYFICGPEPMIDAMEKALKTIEVPEEHIHDERFSMV